MSNGGIGDPRTHDASGVGTVAPTFCTARVILKVFVRREPQYICPQEYEGREELNLFLAARLSMSDLRTPGLYLGSSAVGKQSQTHFPARRDSFVQGRWDTKVLASC